MNAECRLMNKFQGGQLCGPVFAGIVKYLPVNIASIENTDACLYI